VAFASSCALPSLLPPLALGLHPIPSQSGVLGLRLELLPSRAEIWSWWESQASAQSHQHRRAIGQQAAPQLKWQQQTD